MFKKVKATTVEEYLNSVSKEQKEDFLFLHELIKKTAPSLKPHFSYNMIGYGTFEYKNSKTKQMMPWHVIGLAAQKNYISLYVCATNNKNYIAEMHKDKLGKVKVGKSCINIKNYPI